MVPPTIQTQLSRLRWRERFLRLAWGTVLWLAFAGVLLLAACFTDWLIDRWQDTPFPLRVFWALAQVALWVAAAVVLFVTLFWRRLSDDQVALWVEARVPAFAHRLISAVQLNRPGANVKGMSPALIAALTREAEEQARRTNFAKLADHRRLTWSGWVIVPFVLIFGGLYLLFPGTVRALLARQLLQDREIPRSVYLESAQAEIVWPSGEEVVLRFRVRGLKAGQQPVGLARIEPLDRPSEHYPLTFESAEPDGEAIYTATVPAGSLDFSYRAWLKDGRTRQPASVHYEPRPAVVQQEAWVLLPEYVGKRPDGGLYEVYQPKADIAGPADSFARVVAAAQKPIITATVELLGHEFPDAPETVRRRLPMDLAGDTQAAIFFDLRPNETAYRILLRDKNGFSNLNPPRRSVSILPDEPPQVSLLPERFPGDEDRFASEDTEVEGMPVPLGRSIRIAYACRGPYGLGKAQLKYRVKRKDQPDAEPEWTTLPLAEVKQTAQSGPFDPRRGCFEKTGPKEQIDFHAVPSADPELFPGRTEGGGRFDFQTRALPELSVGDQVEFFVEVFDRNPAQGRAPGRSEARLKTVVTEAGFVDWVLQTLQQEKRIQQLEAKQRGVFGKTGSEP